MASCASSFLAVSVLPPPQAVSAAVAAVMPQTCKNERREIFFIMQIYLPHSIGGQHCAGAVAQCCRSYSYTPHRHTPQESPRSRPVRTGLCADFHIKWQYYCTIATKVFQADFERLAIFCMKNLEGSEFRWLEIDWSDTYHNQVDRKGGFDEKNSFYSARKISFGQQRTAQRTFSKEIWTIYRRWTVRYRSFKILRLIWHPWILGENAVCCAWTIVHKKKGANHESGNLLPPEQRRWI